MIAHRLATAALPLLLAGLSTTAAAQVRNLDTESPEGKVFTGELRAERSPSVFRLQLPARQGIELEALPVGSSDPQMKVFDAQSSALIAENDDRPGSIAARVRLWSETAKAVRIEVSASPTGPELAPGARFRLVVLPTDYRPTPPRPLADGGRISGELDAGDEQLFRFRGEAGQIWVLSLTAPEPSRLDPLLEVFAGDATTGEPLAKDDDGGGDLNARLRFRVPRTGNYTVRATSVGNSGAFVLTASVGAATAVRDGVLDLGRATSGELTGDTQEQFYRLSDAARARLAGGGSLVIEMKATAGSDLDSLVEAGFETPLGFSAVGRDDDGGGGLDSRLEVDLSGFQNDPGWLDRFRIRAASATSNEGEYEITVSRQ